MNRANVNNGRVDLTKVFPPKSFTLYDEPNDGNKHFNNEALKGIQIKSELSNLFFSQKNIDYLQNKIIQTIYSKYKYIISRQSDLELKIIMRAFYLQFSRNRDCSLQEQVDTLNEMVLKDSLSIILTNIEQYIEYKKDISSLKVPMARSVSMSSAGTKSRPLNFP